MKTYVGFIVIGLRCISHLDSLKVLCVQEPGRHLRLNEVELLEPEEATSEDLVGSVPGGKTRPHSLCIHILLVINITG